MNTDTDISFNALRNAAFHRSQELGLPTNKLEAWRYVDLAPLAAALDDSDAEQVKKGVVMPVGRSSEPGMVVTNGCWDPSASPTLPGGVGIHSVAGDSVAGDPLVARWLRQLAQYDDIGAVWSLSDMRSGVELGIDQPVERPLIILNLATDASSAWRSVIRLAEGASAKILLIHLVAPTSRSCLGIEVELLAGSRLWIDEVEFSSSNQEPLGQLLVDKQASVGQDAELNWNCITRGGKLVRHHWLMDLMAAGASITCRGGGVINGSVQAHHHLRMRHRCGNTTSRQLFKQVLDHGGRCSFDGLVRVDPGADDSNADQLCRSLLLDDQSIMAGRPQLEIEADEVVATHGAAIARPQEDELWYLRSRGIDGDQANQLLIDGFLAEVARGFSFPASRALAEQQLALTLPEEP